MSTMEQLADRLRRTAHGPMWHGPALAELASSFTPTDAAARLVPGAHGAWELVLHVAAWAEIALARLDGEPAGSPPPEVDGPPCPARRTMTRGRPRGAGSSPPTRRSLPASRRCRPNGCSTRCRVASIRWA